jgi:hypothetical protein
VGDDLDLSMGFGDSAPLSSDPAPVSAVAVPTSQTDFNVAGLIGDAKSVLTSGAAAVTSVATGIGAVEQARATASFNSAAAAQAQSLGLQQLQTQGTVAKLQNATQVAQAQSMYNRAAGIIASPSGLAVILAIASVVIGAMALRRKK